MPILQNAKQERFCQLRLEGKTMEEAYRLAGYKPNRKNAQRMMSNEGVKARMQELHIHALNKVEVTVESIAAGLDECIAKALEYKQVSAAVAAQMGKAKLFGLVTDKSTVNVTHNYAMMTEEELRFEIAAIHAEFRTIKPGVQH
jgi:Terminase small subunit